MSDETEIQAEVEALKARFQDTKQLYREVCALLFFRFDITPTANKLYQYVRRGTMSAPADALAQFWADLRSKSRIEIDHPDLPDEVKGAAATAIAAIWQQASAAARDELREVRSEAAQDVAAAQAKLLAAEAHTRALEAGNQAAQERLAASAAGADQLRAELEAERRAHAASAGRIQELQRTIDELRVQAQRLQDGFSADLAKAREASETANARADAAERRALLEVDQERQARLRAEKALDTLRTQAAQTEEKLRAEAQAATAASARQSAALEAAERANRDLTARAECDAQAADALRVQLRAAEDDAAAAKAATQALQGVIDRIAPSVADAGLPATAARTRRKAPPKD